MSIWKLDGNNTLIVWKFGCEIATSEKGILTRDLKKNNNETTCHIKLPSTTHIQVWSSESNITQINAKKQR